MEVHAVSWNHRSRPIVWATLTLAVAVCVSRPSAWPQLHAAGILQAQPALAEAGIRQTLQRYSAALESLDADAVKKVQPSISLESLTKAFRDMRELKVTIDTVRVLSADAKTARVSCRVTQTLTPRAGSKQTNTVTRVMRLRRDADMWVIDGFER